MSIAWTKKIEGGPMKVNHAAATIDGYIYSFGGYCTNENFTIRRDIDIHRFDTVSMTWAKLRYKGDPADIPYQRYGHSVVAFGHSCILYGGRNDVDGVSNYVYKFDVVTGVWSRPEVSGNAPSGRDGHSCTVIGDKMYMFGGYEECLLSFSKALYTLNLTSYEWTLVKHTGLAPLWRDFHTAITLQNNMVVFGGRSDRSGPYHTNREEYDNNIYIYNSVDRHWTCPSVTGEVPEGRRSHCSFEHGGKVYVFGGYNGVLDAHYNDLHVFEPDKSLWSVCRPAGNSIPRVRRRASCCKIDDELFVFGGTSPKSLSRCMSVDEDTDDEDRGQEVDQHLMELSDMNILDMASSLKTRCMMAIVKQKIDYRGVVPLTLAEEMKYITKESLNIVPHQG